MPGQVAAARVSRAAVELQKSRCSLPGESDCAHTATVMSKSKLSVRFWYCAVSTVRTRAVDAEPLEVLGEGQRDALERGDR